MEEVYEKITPVLEAENITCMMQQQNMNEKMREDFLLEFEQEREKVCSGFAYWAVFFQRELI